MDSIYIGGWGGRAHARYISTCILSSWLILPAHSSAEISVYDDCSIGLDLRSSDENLTASERAGLLDQQFETEIADGDRCEVSESGSAGSGSGGGNSGGSSDAAQGSEGGQASANAMQSTVEASPNSLTNDQTSIAVASDLGLSPESSPSSASQAAEGNPGSNGKNHEALSSANNREALAKSILERAQAEEDPTVKAALMKRYKELSK